jgi:hypothetical protein
MGKAALATLVASASRAGRPLREVAGPARNLCLVFMYSDRTMAWPPHQLGAAPADLARGVVPAVLRAPGLSARLSSCCAAFVSALGRRSAAEQATDVCKWE